MLKNRDFINLGFTNKTEVNEKHLEDTVLVYQIVKDGGSLVFRLYPDSEMWEIWEGRTRSCNRKYADARILTPEHLESLTNVYLVRSAQMEGL